MLVAESRKYNDVLAVPATAQVGDEVALSLKSGMTADETITVTVSQGDRDTNKAYLKVVGGKLQLAQPNSTGGHLVQGRQVPQQAGDGQYLSRGKLPHRADAAHRRHLCEKLGGLGRFRHGSLRKVRFRR